MFDQLMAIAQFIADSFIHIWPYLLITIPISVAVQLSGASKYINRAFTARPLLAIVLATVVGAFSPFCSCGVIPVIAALLIGGVPLAPVMAFWVASPSMDPEIFFLSVGALGWELALWRITSTLVISLSAGFITHWAVQSGWLGDRFIRRDYSTEVRSSWTLVKTAWRKTRRFLGRLPVPGWAPAVLRPVAQANLQIVAAQPPAAVTLPVAGEGQDDSSCSDGASTTGDGSACAIRPPSFRRRLFEETVTATTMVVKFMALAFFLEALITLYVPSEWITALLGAENPLAILTAALLGVPVYTSNLAALPMIGGLLSQGMDPGAALAFLIAGPTTTLPAMAAVWGLATRKVFALYVSFSLVGAIAMGYLYSLVAS